jgi:hypothetical protein
VLTGRRDRALAGDHPKVVQVVIIEPAHILVLP